ncbi:MAG: site-specific DNA-methyltransferase [Bacteroidales bacterium]|nr:site-specific DNA-methyltransferase [Bacteroidales bacterium]
MEVNKIYKGDSLELMQGIEPESIDLICTDPPYIRSMGRLYKWEVDFVILAQIFNEILSDVGQIAIFGDFPTSVEIAIAFQNYFSFRYFNAWVKSNGQPVNKKQPRSNIELVTVWKRQNTKTKNLVFNPMFRPGEPYRRTTKANNPTRKQSKSYETNNKTGNRWPEQTLYYPSKDNLSKSERTSHPTQKSVGLVGNLVKTLSNENDLVLDPFSGSGTTAIVCHRLNRRFICIEKDENYYKESIKRLKEEQRQLCLV